MTTCNAGHSLRRPAWTARRSAGAAAFIAAAAAAAALLSANAATAQGAKRDPIAAEALFQEARKLIKAGDYEEGCPKFEAALALYPSASTMLNIADCREHEGKVAAAWEAYHRALVLNRETQGAKRQASIEEAAKQGISKLEPRLPKLLIEVESPPPGVKVMRDGRELPESALGEALPADPGEHEVNVSAPGHRSETRSVTLREGETTKVELSLVKDAGSSDTKGGGVPVWVWVTGGAGIALTGVSIYFLADDLSAISALRENCITNETGTRCAPGYDYESDNARKSRGLGLFLGLGGAGVLAIGAATAGLILSSSSSSSSKEPEPKPAVTASGWVLPGSAGAVVSGRF